MFQTLVSSEKLFSQRKLEALFGMTREPSESKSTGEDTLLLAGGGIPETGVELALAVDGRAGGLGGS